MMKLLFHKTICTIFHGKPTSMISLLVESQNILDDYPTTSDEQDPIVTDLELRSTRRQENTDDANADAADNDSLSREVAEADLRSARQETKTDTDNNEHNSRDLHDEDSQSTRRQQSTEFENDEVVNQDSPKILIFQLTWGMIHPCPMY